MDRYGIILVSVVGHGKQPCCLSLPRPAFPCPPCGPQHRRLLACGYHVALDGRGGGSRAAQRPAGGGQGARCPCHCLYVLAILRSGTGASQGLQAGLRWGGPCCSKTRTRGTGCRAGDRASRCTGHAQRAQPSQLVAHTMPSSLSQESCEACNAIHLYCRSIFDYREGPAWRHHPNNHTCAFWGVRAVRCTCPWSAMSRSLHGAGQIMLEGTARCEVWDLSHECHKWAKVPDSKMKTRIRSRGAVAGVLNATPMSSA